MLKVSDIRQHFINELAAENFVIDKTGVKTIEMIGANFEADQPTIFGEVNEEYVDRELEWYKSMSLYVKDIPVRLLPSGNMLPLLKVRSTPTMVGQSIITITDCSI
jgi:hypothetical protein